SRVLWQDELVCSEGQVQWLRRAGWQIDELHEFLVLVSADVCKAFNLPRHDCREAFARRRRGGPLLERHGLPCLVPDKRASGNRRRRRTDVRAEREEPIETSKELDIPRFGLGNGHLRKDRVGVGEDLDGTLTA